MDYAALEEQWANWMRAAISGDANAYQQFFEAVTPRLRSMTKKRCNQFRAPEGDAEDVLQEVLIAIHLKKETWDMNRPIGPWLTTIVRNKIIASLRRRGSRIMVPIEDVIDTLQADESPSSLDTLDANRLTNRLRNPQRDIVRSISINGSTIRETAERLRMTEGSVRVALHRALKTLAGIYRNEQVEN